MKINTQHPKRLLIWLIFGNIIIAFFIFGQWSEEELLTHRIEGREERLIAVRNILEKNPYLIKNTQQLSPSDKNLSTLINEALTNLGLTHQVVSQNPTIDIKKNEEKIKLQLKDVPLAKVIELMKTMTKSNSKIREVDMDLSGGEQNDQWKFSASWVMPAIKP